MNEMKEKRETPRLEEKLPLKVSEGNYQAVVETKNISASGVYFTADQPLPVMSKVMVMLLLPTGAKRNTKIECRGTVVRVMPMTAGEGTKYETAIFFDDITDRNKHILSRHVKKLMARAT